MGAIGPKSGKYLSARVAGARIWGSMRGREAVLAGPLAEARFLARHNRDMPLAVGGRRPGGDLADTAALRSAADRVH